MHSLIPQSFLNQTLKTQTWISRIQKSHVPSGRQRNIFEKSKPSCSQIHNVGMDSPVKECIVNTGVSKEGAVNVTWGNQEDFPKKVTMIGNLEGWLVQTRGKCIVQKEEHTGTGQGGRVWCVWGVMKGPLCWSTWFSEGTRQQGRNRETVRTAWHSIRWVLGSGLGSHRPGGSLGPLPFLRMKRWHLLHFSSQKNEALDRTRRLAPEIIWEPQTQSPRVLWLPSVLTHRCRKPQQKTCLRKQPPNWVSWVEAQNYLKLHLDISQ